MATHLVNLVIDARRPRELAGFWSSFLGWQIVLDADDEVDGRAPACDGWELDLSFVPVPEAKEGQNRRHLDLASASPDQQRSTVDRALEWGARRVDIGQSGVPWEVLADPEASPHL